MNVGLNCQPVVGFDELQGNGKLSAGLYPQVSSLIPTMLIVLVNFGCMMVGKHSIRKEWSFEFDRVGVFNSSSCVSPFCIVP